MDEMNLEKERIHGKEVYEKWDFVKRIVELYAEGVSWKGCDKVEVDSIRNGVRSMLVTGVGDFNIEGQNGMQTVSVQMQSNFPLGELGHPFLWPATRNSKQLEQMVELLNTGNPEVLRMVELLQKDMCLGLGVPHELLGPLSATADADAIMWGITTFSGNIRTWRDYLGYRLGLSWNENWYQSGFLRGYGPVYQVFRAQGIDLRTLRAQVLNAAKSALDNSLVSKQTYNESIKWF